ncbi:MAG: TetR/AcrR family transcriptional regulator [Acidobacteria bacterium]|nr:TetR/AcrR family transcriptional regulator [Acidobacteriota bacterium]
MTVKERRLREKAELRQEILDAARELFVREGYENFSMRKLAEKIEYSPTTIYLYFKDKADLLFNLCEETFSKLVQQLETIASLATDPLDGLRAGMLAYVEFGVKHPANYLVTFVLPHPIGTPDSERYLCPTGMGLRAFDCLRQAVAECVRAGKFRSLDLEKASQAIWAVLHGVTSLLVVHPDFPWVDRNDLVDQVIETTIEGLKA